MKKTIGFHSNQLSIRGTEVALYDYAEHNETLLNNNSFILFNKNNPSNYLPTIQKFRNRFEVIEYTDPNEIDQILSKNKADLFYAIKSGKKDGVCSQVIPTMVHAVFPTSPSQVHGSSFAFISDWLSKHCSNGKIPCVPHMIQMPNIQTDLRSELGIPKTGLVLGSYGGQDSFDVPCAIETIQMLLNQDPNIYFIFLNITAFLKHERCIFLPGNSDIYYKTKFINSCDAMLHARLQGESFGLACGEFSVRNKPIITYSKSRHTHHCDVLGGKGFYYEDTLSLRKIILQMKEISSLNTDWDCYTKNYNPTVVMKSFDQNLIQVALHPERNIIHLGLSEQLQYFKLKLEMRLARFKT